MRFYHCLYGLEEAEAILRSGLQDRPLDEWRHRANEAAARRWGVVLTDDPILSYEHCGSDYVCVQLACSEQELAPFEDLQVEGFTDHIGPLLEEAWIRKRVPLIGTTYRNWVVPAEWLRPRVVRLDIVSGTAPEDLWALVAHDRRRSSNLAPLESIDARLEVLARTLHTRPYDGRRFDEDRRPGTIAIQESTSVAHFDRLVQRLAEWDVPLSRCGWLLAEAARRVAIDSFRLGREMGQLRAAKMKSNYATAQDVPAVREEAVRLRREGVPVAQLRRRLIAKFGADKVPSETVIRRRWLRYVRVDTG